MTTILNVAAMDPTRYKPVKIDSPARCSHCQKKIRGDGLLVINRTLVTKMHHSCFQKAVLEGLIIKKYKFIASVYPDGFPIRYQNDKSGKLPALVKKLLRFDTIDGEEFEMIKEYLVYHIQAPCWASQSTGAPYLALLKSKILKASNELEVHEYMKAAIQHGINIFQV